MQPLANPGRPQAAPGRWIWVLSGTLTIAVVGSLGSAAIVWGNRTPGDHGPTTVLPTHTVTVTQPVSALNVQSYGAPIKVNAAPSGPVQFAET
ncbi:MAG TPA: hypothetical protein VF223_03830, partial [Trebonia sp.]